MREGVDLGSKSALRHGALGDSAWRAAAVTSARDPPRLVRWEECALPHVVVEYEDHERKSSTGPSLDGTYIDLRVVSELRLPGDGFESGDAFESTEQPAGQQEGRT